jgi:hypothetical protein
MIVPTHPRKLGHRQVTIDTTTAWFANPMTTMQLHARHFFLVTGQTSFVGSFPWESIATG